MVQVLVQDQVSQEVTINASIERVWSLLTEGIGQWFPDNGADINLKPGGDIRLHWREYGTIHAQVERLEPHHTFALRWASNAGEDPTPGKSTLVEFTLTPAPDGVLLRVVESGFSQLSVAPEEQEHRATENTKGWKIELGELRTLAEQPSA